VSGSGGSAAKKGLEPGTSFGRYEIVRRIGSGGMATVYEARHVDLAKRVALKTLHRWLALRLDVVQRFVQEARTASRIDHPHVLGISDIGVEHDVPFMAMDLLEGEELAHVLHREGPLPATRLADLLLPVISAVAAAHEQGILHRDLKPENIFLARRRLRGEHPVLLDFGISKVQGGDMSGLTAADELLGTPPYMSPEQVIDGMAELDARSDQYALGVILYECATGELPYRNDDSIPELLRMIARGGVKPPSSRVAALPRAFDALVLRALSVSREARFPSVIELGRDLLPFASPLVQAMWAEEFGARDSPVPTAPHARRGPGLPVTVRRDELDVIPCLAECDDAALDQLLAVAPGSRVSAGELLFEQGTTAQACFFLLAGEVEIRRGDARATVRAGSMIGGGALADGALREATAIVRVEATVLELGREVFESLSERQPELTGRILDRLAQSSIRRLREASTRLEEVSRSSSTRDRELAYLRLAIAEWSVSLDDSSGPSRRRPL
jgi:CRP-like cAMP-binding protein/tRNA A-37 threonylcarbamoyl transferase component Bud32